MTALSATQAMDQGYRPSALAYDMMTGRKIRCRMTTRLSNRCQAEAVDPLGEILICQRHLALALELAGHLPGIKIILGAA